MGANVAALVIIVLAIFLMIVGLRGTQAAVWHGLFSNVKLPGASGTQKTSDTTGGTGGTGGTGSSGGTSGTTPLTFNQLKMLAQEAGFNQADSIIAAAVALAESAGIPSATGPVGERGLWQIYPAAHPDLAAKYNLYDPLQNAEAAFAVFQEQGWHAWTTYTNGAYKQFLPTM